MCGICGQVRFSGPAVDRKTVEAMTDALSHRGPDDQGLYLDGSQNGGPSVGFGHRRLSIIDLSSAGHQPMSNSRGTAWIVYNGEIYNFPELRRELSEKGYPFRSRTDTEVILAAYDTWGIDFLKKLNGMFAFAIWDGERRRLLLARDHAGIKPLFVSIRPDRILFGSELKSVVQDPGLDRRISPFSLTVYLTLGYIPAPLSIFESVVKLPPAHYLLWEQGSVEVRPYWSLNVHDKLLLRDEREYAEAVREKLARAVRSQLVSDVPLGAFLSGGVDSSAIVALMSEAAGTPVRTFSIGFEGMGLYDERKFALSVSREFATDHREFVVRPDAMDILPRVCKYVDEPFADSSTIPTYYLAELARKQVTVILTGTGGDDIFAGYHRYAAHRVHSLFRLLPGVLKEGLSRVAARLPGSRKHLAGETILYLQRFCQTLSLSDEEAYQSLISIFPRRDVREIFNGFPEGADVSPGPGSPFRPRLSGGEDLFRPLFEETRGENLLDRLMYVDYHTYLPDDLLVKEDRMTMAHGLEGRVPFLDRELVETAASIPANVKLKGLTTKYILKKALEPVLPREIVHRRKHGFAVPVSEWLRTDLRELAMDVLLRKSGRYFHAPAVERLYREHLEGVDHGDRLWALLVFEIWRERIGGV